MPKIVVLGGGYSGLACLIELFKKDRSLELHLVDAHLTHCKVTNLHKTFRHPVDQFLVPYSRLAEKFHFTFHRVRLTFTLEELARWQARKRLPLHQSELPFDYLVVSTGAATLHLPGGQRVLNQNDLRRGDGRAVFENLIERWEDEPAHISVVGGGATGIQVLFELHEELRKKRAPHTMRLVDLNRQLVPNRPKGFHTYISKKMIREGIDYLPETKYLGQSGEEIRLEEGATGRKYALPSDLTLLFPGVAAAPLALKTNGYGQVLKEGQVMPDIFSAGDCSRFNSPGLNLLTAQAAVRKGKLVARNICGLCRGKRLQEYRYQEKGYIVSLGATDAIGWIGLRFNLVKGFTASVIKDAMEAQYDLFLDGVDTYLNF